MCDCKKEIEIKIKKENSEIEIPQYAHDGDAGFDFKSTVDVEIPPNNIKSVMISTGLRFQIPKGYYMEIVSRSGFAAKNHVFVTNAPGIIDSTYTGIVNILLTNLGSDYFIIKKGDRIAQGIIKKLPDIKFIEVDNLDKTNRGDGGFGSTNVY